MNKERTHYIKHFWQFIRPYKKPLRTVYILYFLNSILNLIPALSVRFYIDLQLFEQKASFFGFRFFPVMNQTLHMKIFIGIIFLLSMAVLIIVANSIGVIMWRKNARSVQRVVYDIRIKIHQHIEKLSLCFFENERVGNIMTKAVGDVTNVSLFLQNSFFVTYGLVQFLFTPVLMIAFSPLLFGVALIPLPLIIYAFYSIRVKLKPLYVAQRENESALNAQIQEVISGIREIKAFNLEERSTEAYRNINQRDYDLQNRIMRVFSFNHQLQYGSRDLAIILITVLGSLFVFYSTGGVTIGMITSFLVLAGYFYTPVSQFINFYNIIQRGMASLERIIDFLNILPDIKDRKDAHPLDKEKVKGQVEFKEITFAYSRNEPVLKNINLNVSPGDKIAIVGPSGSGKSTLVSLLLRFYDVQAGMISVDGINIADVQQASLRKNIGIVFQETFLFYGTIKDNLLFVCPDRGEDDIIVACKAANIYDTILTLPDKFDTLVGERGVRLSGGQKQRIAIARVFLKDPKIVILDEATSAVDNATEVLIQQSIEKMLVNRTAFIIAHRLSTIRDCNKIIVLADNGIAETGTHEELLNRKGLYYTLYKNV